MAKKKNQVPPDTSKEAFNRFKQIFERLAYKQSYATIFEDFLDFSLYMLSVYKSPEQIEQMKRMEEKYKTKEEAEMMAELFLLFGQAAENYNGPFEENNGLDFKTKGIGFHDILGDLFMDLVSHGHNGQYFTPQHICDMMSLMIMGDPNDKGKDPFSGDVKTVLDPACGSGRMLMSAAKIDRYAHFYGADVSSTCVKMTALNMVVNTMVGEVACMNSLSLEHYWSFHIRKVLVGTHWMPMLFRTGKNQTRMCGVESMEEPNYDYELTDDGQVIPLQKIRSVDELNMLEKIKHLFKQIPAMDAREQIKAKAMESMDMMEKYALFDQLSNTPEPEPEKEPPAKEVKLSPGPYSDQLTEVVKEFKEYRQGQPEMPVPIKKPAIVKNIKTKKQDLPKTGTLF